MRNLKRIFKTKAYLYIFIGFAYIVYCLFYDMRMGPMPILVIIYALLVFIVYAAINHIFIRKKISHKMLILIEALLLVTMVTLTISFLKRQQFKSYQHFKKEIITVLPHPDN